MRIYQFLYACFRYICNVFGFKRNINKIECECTYTNLDDATKIFDEYNIEIIQVFNKINKCLVFIPMNVDLNKFIKNNPNTFSLIKIASKSKLS